MKKGTSKTLLLDVNVLLALVWPNHQFHRAALNRLEGSSERWATCALTQLGFIRISSNPAVVGVSRTPAEASALLAVLTRDPHHIYLETLQAPSEASMAGCFARILGSKQVTDAYLLRLAALHGSRLLTFDGRIAAMSDRPGEVEVLAG